MTIGVRAIQALLGMVCVLLAATAAIRSASLVIALSAIGMMIGGYLSSRTIPDAFVSRDAVWRVRSIGLIIIAIGIAAHAAGGAHVLKWAAIVMAYCAGNRLRAAGIGPAR